MPVLHFSDEFDEGADFSLVAAVAVAIAGEEEEALITQSDVSGTITLAIYERGSITALYSTNLTTSTVVFNTPQLDAFWGMDRVGYNFRTRVRMVDVDPGATILKGGKRYTAIVKIPTSANGTLRVVGSFKLHPLHA